MLAAGSHLGPYTILAPLGAGGMGEVYRARDPRLGREVAVKVLPEGVSGDADRLRRFEQEARAASALNHPNILTVFDTGSENGTVYLVTELLEGETLRERLAGGALPARKAVEIGIHIARGLAAAHEKGIVHRDLKPENLFLTRDGRVKILDFGLARLQPSSIAEAPTILTGTEPGVVLGTVGYMAPEQVRGQPADHRADLFALGAVLYEMLAGRRAFQRDSAAETMTAILREEPPELAVPPGVDALVRHCLEKAPGERFQSARDLAFNLERLTGSASGAAAGPPARALRRSARWLPLLLAGGLALLAVGYLAGRGRGTGDKDAVEDFRFTRLTHDAELELRPAISPDGDEIAYALGDFAESDIYLRRVGSENAVNLTPDSPGSDLDPAFSPDGRQIAFRSKRGGGSGIFLMGTTGESVRRLTDKGYHPAWSPDGREIAFSEDSFGFSAAARSGSESRLLAVEVATGATRLLVDGQDAVQPSWSPHGHRIAFWGIRTGTSQRDVWTVPAAGVRKPEDLVAVTADTHLDWNPFWSPDGRWLYFLSDRDGTFNLWRVPIEEESGKILGAPEPSRLPSSDILTAAGARDGSIVYPASEVRGVIERYPFDPARARITGPAETLWAGGELGAIDVSPVSGEIVLSTVGAREDLVLLRADGKLLRKLTNGPARHRRPRWAPDGSSIAFQSDRDGGVWGIWTVRPDGSGLRRLSATGRKGGDPVWASDGRRLWANDYTEASPSGFFLRLGDSRIEHLPSAGPGLEFWADDWSADGRSLAGHLIQSGRPALYDVAARKFTLAGTPGDGRVRWLRGNRRLLAATAAAGQLDVIDLDRKTSSTVLDFAPPRGLMDFALTPDERWLLVMYPRIEGDLWRREPQSGAARTGRP
ncbi:MAG: eukaryotic-like serine/threonine-protein kinase [Acidobacteriota bacterium]|jgi:Tol biopolymer transport system component|nr:eukaryotic-like serine/threonine-protein kinase [Acidobacteriota bacterium]